MIKVYTNKLTVQTVMGQLLKECQLSIMEQQHKLDKLDTEEHHANLN